MCSAASAGKLPLKKSAWSHLHLKAVQAACGHNSAEMNRASQAVGAALAVLRLCARAAQLIESKQLYKAYKVGPLTLLAGRCAACT